MFSYADTVSGLKVVALLILLLVAIEVLFKVMGEPVAATGSLILVGVEGADAAWLTVLNVLAIAA